VDRVSHAVAMFGGCLMLTAGALIVVNISMRWFLSVSIAGDVELVQTATAIAAFAFLPFGQINRSTIVIDTFTQRLPGCVRNYIDAFWDFLYAIISAILSWRLAVGAVDAIRNHTVTTVLGMPIGWFMFLGTIMLLILTLAALATMSRLLRGSN
jgi:TRAP-type C4-dicarboxylate transport system permease small subunit